MQQEETHTAPSAFVPRASIPSMSIDDACLFAEAKLQEVRQLLLDARPESVDRCQNELQQVVATLFEGLIADGSVANQSRRFIGASQNPAVSARTRAADRICIQSLFRMDPTSVKHRLYSAGSSSP